MLWRFIVNYADLKSLSTLSKSTRLRPVPTGEKRSGLFRASKDLGIFAVCYVLAFLIFRFDIPRHGAWFRHPLPTGSAAWIAFILAIAGFLYVKKTTKN